MQLWSLFFGPLISNKQFVKWSSSLTGQIENLPEISGSPMFFANSGVYKKTFNLKTFCAPSWCHGSCYLTNLHLHYILHLSDNVPNVTLYIFITHPWGCEKTLNLHFHIFNLIYFTYVVFGKTILKFILLYIPLQNFELPLWPNPIWFEQIKTFIYK